MNPRPLLRRILIGAAAVGLGACRARSNEPPESRSRDAGGFVSSARHEPPAPVKQSPLSRAELPTTDSSIAVGNLEADIKGGEHDLAAHPSSTLRLLTLVEQYAVRGRYLGHLRDYDRATELAERLVTVAPRDYRSYLARAGARSTLHRFEETLADLAKATELKAPVEQTDDLRASVLQATGRYDEALVLRQRLTGRRTDITSLGNEATLLAAMGRTEEAEQNFIEAEYHYRDVSPFPVAWLWFQEALMWEGVGRPGRARKLLEAALERLPPYAPAIAHLAALEPAPKAMEMLTPLVATSDDPEYAAQLSVLLREAGDVARADPLLARAKNDYRLLIQREPAAFADHAARFWLGPGGDPELALSLAQRNVAVRPTPQAKQLVKEAELAARAASSSER